MSETASSTSQCGASACKTDVSSPSPSGRGRGEGERDNRKPEPVTKTSTDSLSKTKALILSLVAIVSFHLAYTFVPLALLIFIYLACLFQLSRLPTPRSAFYVGLLTGFGCALQACFFWNIFGPAAVALW